MGFLDRLFGRDEPEPQQQPQERWGRQGQPGQLSDEQALARYRYMLQTAPPEDIERAHEEAFMRLTPEQRQMVLRELASEVPASERAGGDDPRSLARMATRAELRRPGTLERAFGRVGGPAGAGGGGFGGGGFGGGFGGPGLGSIFLTSIAASFVGTAIAQSFFANDSGFSEAGVGGGGGEGGGGEGGEAGADAGGGEFGEGSTYEGGWGDSGDTGATDFGGDFGGGDFGGGDFGGGDFGGDF